MKKNSSHETYKQRADTPTGFCHKCGYIPSKCKCIVKPIIQKQTLSELV